MSFHCVAFGIFISNILDIGDLFRLVAKKCSVLKDSDSSVSSEDNIERRGGESEDDFNEDTL